MAITNQPLYRAGALEPALGYDDVACLIDQGGLVQKYDTAYYGVQGIRPTLGWGPHGLTLMWTQSGAAPAGYPNVPVGLQAGNIAIGGSFSFGPSSSLNLGNYQLVQMRFALEVLALTGAVTLHDLDLQQFWGNIQDLGVPNLPSSGSLNMVDQFESPGDSIVDPAQNANKALPAAFPAVHPRDIANMTETYWFENNPPTWKVTNNGGAAITGGGIGLRFWGFRYYLAPLKDDGTWIERWVAGAWRRAPATQRIVAIPTVPPTGTAII